MSKLIKSGACTPNSWNLYAGDEITAELNSGNWLVPLAIYDKMREEDGFEPSRLGLWVNGEQELETISPLLRNTQVIAILFPAFVDGRGFSLGRMIREHKDYQGELRAIGNFMQDQLFYLSRCGFDAFEIPDEADESAYLSSLNDFSESYQAAVDEPQPLFRRR